ncbi:IS3 family transposase, partial [Streptomyces sp. TRM49041]|uniref:IS3 family transposase n=1 Tax=Streptomyces sp. TRM49041 TaxID=2603216 RepID=UPI0011EE79B9
PQRLHSRDRTGTGAPVASPHPFNLSGTYGHRRIQAQLHRWGVTAGLELVRRLMRELGLEPCQPRPKR